MTPFILQLARWDGTQTPCLRLHPLALPHLYASELIPQSVVDKLVGAMEGRRVTIMSVRVVERCGLLRQLKVDSMELTLSTAYNSSVTALVPRS
jgi:hypothetical protein